MGAIVKYFLMFCALIGFVAYIVLHPEKKRGRHHE